MATKKTAPVTLPRGAKTQYVLSLPADMPAAEVVEKAAKKGIELTPGHVYNIRSSRKREGDKIDESLERDLARAPMLPSKAVKAEPRDTIPSSALDLSPEATLRSIVAEIGLARAREIMLEIEKAFRG